MIRSKFYTSQILDKLAFYVVKYKKRKNLKK